VRRLASNAHGAEDVPHEGDVGRRAWVLVSALRPRYCLNNDLTEEATILFVDQRCDRGHAIGCAVLSGMVLDAFDIDNDASAAT
jgi:hypothetical protein